MAGEEFETRVDRLLKAIKDNRLIAVLVVIGVVVIGIAQFTTALNDILKFVDSWRQPSPADEGIARQVEMAPSTEASPCAAEGGAAAVRAYAIAVVYPDSLASFVTENAQAFALDGGATKCFRLLTTGLLSGELRVAHEAYERTLAAEMPQGAIEHQRSMVSTYKQAAETFSELASILPPLAEGDAGPYQASQLYQTTQLLNQVWNLTELPPEHSNQLRQFMFQFTEEHAQVLIHGLGSRSN